MPDFRHLLQDSDLDFLARVARLWGIDLPVSSFNEALGIMVAALSDRTLANEVIAALPAEAQTAWHELVVAGRMPLDQFTRQYGEIRVFGEARRKREEPDLHPISVAEILWYRALVGRGFFGTAREPQEYIYIPDELIQTFGGNNKVPSNYEIRPAAENEHAVILIAGPSLIDQLGTMLAEFRKGKRLSFQKNEPHSIRQSFAYSLLKSSGLLTPEDQVDPEKSRQVLEMPLGDSLLFFYQHWMNSPLINDLRMLPGLIFEGSWSNDPLPPRALLNQILNQVAMEAWWSTASLVAEIKRVQPNFQRSAGEYDSWFIRRKADTQYLRGFDSWDEVEGYLLRYLVSGPLHWLGLLDIGLAGKGKPSGSFRLSAHSSFLLDNKAPAIPFTPVSNIKIGSNGQIQVPASTYPALHYQIGRFCRLEKETLQATHYRITSDSLNNAIEQGLKPGQLVALLKRANVPAIPPAFIQLLQNFEKHGSEVKMEKATILSVTHAEVLSSLQKDPRSARCLGDTLTPLTVKVKPGYEETLLKILAELGFLADYHLDV